MNKPDPFSNLRIVLSHTSHPGNIGAAARSMKTMGLGHLYLVAPRYYPDPAADARASGAIDVLNRAKVCATLDEALEGTALVAGLTARRRDVGPGDYTLREAAPELAARARTQPVALLFGNETSGLSNAELGKCQMRVSIPTDPDYSSLNLGSAVQVAAYELRLALLGTEVRQEEPTEELATSGEMEGFYHHLEQTLYRTEFLDPAYPKKLMSRLRRLFARARPRKDEANILRGILTAVDKAIEK